MIAKRVRELPEIEACEVNFATEKAVITTASGSVPLEAINERLQPLGYHLASEQEHAERSEHQISEHAKHLGLDQGKQEKLLELEAQRDLVYFVLPIALTVFVLMMWDIAARLFQSVPNLPIPMELFTILSFVLASVILFWAGRPFVRAVVTFARHRVASMDTLIGIGTLSAYIYSTIITLLPSVREILRLSDYTYFDVTIVVIGFVLLGKYLEARSKLRTGEAIEKLLRLQAKTALVVRDGVEVEVPVDQVQVGDRIRVKPGAKVPVDGMILEGTTSIDESMVTGEAVPVDKQEGDLVIGSTLNKQGSVFVKATKVGKETVLAQIISMVERAQGSRAPIQALADRISSVFVPVVLGVALLSLAGWVMIGTMYLGFSVSVSFGLMSFVGVLVIACPCALGLATPTAIIVGVGKGAEQGVLIKDAESLERLSKVTAVVFDKTGTITRGTPEVSDVYVVDKKFDEATLMQYAASLEALSEHPLAQAIVQRAKGANLSKVTKFVASEGVGVQGVIERRQVVIGKPTQEQIRSYRHVREWQSQGKTVVIVSINDADVGLIAMSDTIKDGAREVIDRLRRGGIKTIMMTGDNARAGAYIAKEVGIDEVMTEVMPEHKANRVQALQASGHRVAMVGDGINDAPALVQADVGIAMATGTDVAMESAGITLLGGDIVKVLQAIQLSRATMRTIKQNLFWAFIYNLVGIPLAAGILYPFLGILLNPVFAGLAMAFSSVSVVANSLRLQVSRSTSAV